jgi:RNA polymerase sigma-70 factor (ECF subfamily)
MTGSVHDAEDLVQETYLRAWRAYHNFEGRSSVRTWLYRIATNVCLTALEGKGRRPLPTGLGAPSSDGTAPVEADGEIPWLEPVPDAVLETGSQGDPAAVVAGRDTIRLAFIAALQHLPPRQRAVLLLRDVVRWHATEVAELLGTSDASVNSALQRAHATLEKADLSEDSVAEPTPEQKAMLDRYVKAFWEKDIEAIVSMLTRDAIWEMPPFTGWYQGNVNIGRLIATQCPGERHDMRMVPTRANGQPAFALYMRGADDAFYPFHLQVLTLGMDGVQHVGAFFGSHLFETFGLPASLPADRLPA